MANCGKEILIAREGTEQQQRFIDALNPGSVKLNDFSLNEWMQFAFHFAKQVNYFDVSDFKNPKGNWQEFFKSEKELVTFINDKELVKFFKDETGSKNITPHLALFICFIKLLEVNKNRFNKLTNRHLDFYFGNILKIEKLAAEPDKVHLIFELAKNIVDEKIAKETELDGGKDAKGTKLIYKLTEELIANKIKVAQLKSVYNSLQFSKLKAADTANSFDGIGGDFPNDDVKWWPFGYFENVKSKPPSAEDDTEAKEKADYLELSDAKVGFALSSEILELKEGLRSIKVTVDFKTALGSISEDALFNKMEVYCSGEKKWLGPYFIQKDVKYADEDDDNIFSSNISTDKTKLSMAFQLPREEEAVVNYDSKVLGEFFNSKLPVCRFIIKTDDKDGHDLYRDLTEKELTNINLEVNVRKVKTLLLESDIGTLNAKKPFYPFGTQPVRKSNFYINYPELFKKEWTNLDVEIEWKNTPNNFKDLYFAYREKHRYKVTPITYFSGLGDYISRIIQKPSFEAPITFIGEAAASIPAESTVPTNAPATESVSVFQSTEDNLIVKNDDYFKANIEIQNKEEWEFVQKEFTFFEKDIDVYKTNFSVSNTGYTVDKNGPVRMSLNQSFLHELYPKIYALAFSSEDDNALIPNEPYTPFIETIRLDYTAKSFFNPGSTKKEYEANEVMLFHEHPFGETEEHPYLREQLDFMDPDDKKNLLVPTYCKGGELYIGLENIEKLQQVSLLIQVLEGSENPLSISFTGKQKVEWSVLCSNEWKNLDSNYMISNETDNFLKSGIVKFSVPKEATSTNTILPEKIFWIRAKIHKDFDAVCKTIDILAQAVLAKFSNNGNDLAHLEKGLKEESISKLVQRVPSVKGVSQPFNSFSGKPKESDEQYYRRISERLRHKNRAITIWDYEHIILQQFPEIHKVKCLNHTKTDEVSGTSFLAPGNVLIVVIPDIINRNVFDIYQPRVSKATLNAVQNWVNKLNTLHVEAIVTNPDYEEVMVDLKVKFHKGYDENFYTKVLKEDITKLLSPWAFEKSASIDFGITLHRSIVINYVEKLEYVDYVEDVILIKGEERSTTKVAPSNPKAILVSAKEHLISQVELFCSNGIIETPETCQT